MRLRSWLNIRLGSGEIRGQKSRRRLRRLDLKSARLSGKFNVVFERMTDSQSSPY